MSNLILIRGDKATLAISGLLDDQGNPTVFGIGDVLTWTAKQHFTTTDSTALIVKSSTDTGIDITTGTDQATVHIAPSDWDTLGPLTRDLKFVWDLQLEVGGDPSQIVTLDSGRGTIKADVTLTIP